MVHLKLRNAFLLRRYIQGYNECLGFEGDDHKEWIIGGKNMKCYMSVDCRYFPRYTCAESSHKKYCLQAKEQNSRTVRRFITDKFKVDKNSR
jgi:hypothetical protein